MTRLRTHVAKFINNTSIMWDYGNSERIKILNVVCSYKSFLLYTVVIAAHS